MRQKMRAISLGFSVVALIALSGCVLDQAPVAEASSGAEDFAALCAPCHGTSGQGKGPMAKDLAHAPADLTGLTARNGGTFPMAYVMHKIWGYAGGAAPSTLMPEFGPLMDSPTVLFDAGDGIQTPTPERLVNLATYLTTIQK
jgi:cytochrome c553